ncbi:zinc-binding dehydrogenase [Rhodopila sp.]|jgi:threonine dehydrogenase-like Zn-dependent dehydrogenase|uniref:zinc-binding dehydrogenase n=1 Tax=Rhodopila sp. TaxID=2480087 RepID=UPI002BD89DC7|nr:zinc-binding dehydrogenase [Rhodopila sp.]HVZ08415.1 zinc-binding dehydrogenase [Rhodopila sp.]
MRAAVLRKGSIVVDTVPDPVLEQGQVLVRSMACGICGSDLHAAKFTRQFVDLAARTGGRWGMDPDRDVVFGHEFCCEVVEYGPNTPARLKPGTPVVSMPLTLSGQTVQGIGYSNDIAGGFAQYMPLADRMLLPVPNGLSPVHAALTEPIAVGWHAVQSARLDQDDVPLVVGCGPVGLAVIAGLAIRGVHPIIAADYSPARRALALKMGADIVVNPAAASPYETWKTTATPDGFDGSRYAQLFGLGPKLRPAVIFECVGVPGVIQQIMEGAPASARIVVVGVCMETDRFEPFFGIVKQLNVQFVLAYTKEEFAESLSHIAEGRVNVAPLVTGTVGLDGVSVAFAELGNPEKHAKIIVDPWT